jgi:hypothetical protein
MLALSIVLAAVGLTVRAPVGEIATVLDGEIATVPVGDNVTFPDAPSVVKAPVEATVLPIGPGVANLAVKPAPDTVLEAERVVNAPGPTTPPPAFTQVARFVVLIAALCGPNVCSAISSLPVGVVTIICPVFWPKAATPAMTERETAPSRLRYHFLDIPILR